MKLSKSLVAILLGLTTISLTTVADASHRTKIESYIATRTESNHFESESNEFTLNILERKLLDEANLVSRVGISELDVPISIEGSNLYWKGDIETSPSSFDERDYPKKRTLQYAAKDTWGAVESIENPPFFILECPVLEGTVTWVAPEAGIGSSPDVELPFEVTPEVVITALECSGSLCTGHGENDVIDCVHFQDSGQDSKANIVAGTGRYLMAEGALTFPKPFIQSQAQTIEITLEYITIFPDLLALQFSEEELFGNEDVDDESKDDRCETLWGTMEYVLCFNNIDYDLGKDLGKP